MHLTYNRRNFMGDGCAEPANGGLSELGRALIAKMNEAGIIVDTPHSGMQTTLDAAKASRKPMMASHTGAKAVFDHMRCKSDAELKAIAATDGLVGVYAMPNMLGPGATLATMLDHVDYIAKLVGVGHVSHRYRHDLSAALAQRGDRLPARPLQSRWWGNWNKANQPLPSTDEAAAGSLAWTNWPLYTVGLVMRGLLRRRRREDPGWQLMRSSWTPIVRRRKWSYREHRRGDGRSLIFQTGRSRHHGGRRHNPYADSPGKHSMIGKSNVILGMCLLFAVQVQAATIEFDFAPTVADAILPRRAEHRRAGRRRRAFRAIRKHPARRGERWIEGRVRLRPGKTALDAVRVRAVLWPLGDDSPAAQAETVPQRPEGWIFVDLRRPKLAAARFGVEALGPEGRIGIFETFLAAEAERPLAAGKTIDVRLDLPPGMSRCAAGRSRSACLFRPGAMGHEESPRDRRRGQRDSRADRGHRPLASRRLGEVDSRRRAAASGGGCRIEARGASEGRPGPAGPREPSLALRASNDRGIMPACSLTVSEQGDAVIVDTGAARYVLGRGPSPIREIWLEGKRAAGPAARGLYVIDQTGRTAVAAADGESLAIEARGPVAACVRLEGFYRTAEGEPLARHITRVECFAGQAFAKVTHTLVLSCDTNKTWFREVGWDFATEPGTGAAATFGTSHDDWQRSLSIAVGGGTSAYMLQDSHYQFAHGTNHFRVAGVTAGRETPAAAGEDKPGTVPVFVQRKRDCPPPVCEGEECGDWAMVCGPQGGLGVACREAARQHPKEFDVAGDHITLKLFSNRAGEELDFRSPWLVKKWDLRNFVKHAVPPNFQSRFPVDKAAALDSDALGWSKTHDLLVMPLPPRSPPGPLAPGGEAHARSAVRTRRSGVDL